MALCFWYGLYKDPHKIDTPLLDRPLPDFSAVQLQNNELITRANFIGKLTVLNVFATWCIACRDENALLMKARHRQDLQIVGLDYRDKKNAAQDWLRHYGNPYNQIIFDPRGKVAIELGVYGTPETFLIDKKGIIRYKQIGSLSEKDWTQKFLPLIQQLEAES